MDLGFADIRGTSGRTEGNPSHRHQELQEIHKDPPIHTEMHHTGIDHMGANCRGLRRTGMHYTHTGWHKMRPNRHHMPSIWEILLSPDPHRAKAETIL